MTYSSSPSSHAAATGRGRRASGHSKRTSPSCANASAGRAQPLRYQPGSNQLLRLMVAGPNSLANERVWTDRIRTWLDCRDGLAPKQRQLARVGGR